MYINAIGSYIPQERIHNNYFKHINGLTDEWIYQRTGIRTRSKVNPNENGDTMGLMAIEKAISFLPYPIEDVDLIISSGYCPLDTVGTLAHLAQQKYQISKAITFMVSSACSSFVNAVEIAQSFFISKKASKALIICSEQNSYYSNESCPIAGHLWGDAAVAMFVSSERMHDQEAEIKEVHTRGLGHIGKGPEGVYLKPKTEGIVMPDGRDVFINATKYMIEALDYVLKRQNLNFSDLNYIAAHQANMRIITHVSERTCVPIDRFVCNIEELGNTGSASAMLAAHQNWHKFSKDMWLGVVVFGGGYSSGSLLIKI